MSFNELKSVEHYIIHKLSGKDLNAIPGGVVQEPATPYGSFPWEYKSAAELNRPTDQVLLEGDNENTIQCLAYAQMMIGVMSINLWRMMGRIVNLDTTNGTAPTKMKRAEVDGEEGQRLKMIGPIMAFESLGPLLTNVFSLTFSAGKSRQELGCVARYATQEKRTRISLDKSILNFLT